MENVSRIKQKIIWKIIKHSIAQALKTSYNIVRSTIMEAVADPVQIKENWIEVGNLRITNPEVIAYFKNMPVEDRELQLRKALEIGVLVLSRVSTSQSLDFINARVNSMLLQVQTYFQQFDGTMRDILSKNLDPAKSESFLARTQSLISGHVDKIGGSLAEVLRDAKAGINSEALKIQQGRESLDRKFDPTNSTGYVAAVIQRMNDFERQLATQFSETDSVSFVNKLKTLVNEHFGDNGKVLQLIEQKLIVDAEGKSPLGQVFVGLKSEIASLRDAVMKLAGQQELIDQTTKKGFNFEDEVFDVLQAIAHPLGDVVEDTSLKVEAITGSKKGDYVYTIISNKTSVVLDAKNYNKLKSLPAMLDYLREAMHERSCKMGIIVAPDIGSLQKQIGTWNVYDNCIITPIDSLEVSIKYARFVLQLQETDAKGTNVGIVRQKLAVVERKLKEFTNLKSKITKLVNGVVSSGTDIQETIELLRQEIQKTLQEITLEMNKSN